MAVLCGQSPEAAYTIAGTVINVRTGQPISRALVELIAFPDPAAVRQDHLEAPAPAATFSDAGGAFKFPGLAPGRYQISARKPEFTPLQEEAAPRFFTLDKSREDLQLRLSPLGVIEGKVVDQDGEPVRGVNIIAVTRPIVDGRRLSRFSRSVSTDDRGLYRLWNLAPESYYIKASGRSNATSLYIGNLGPDTSSSQGFAPVYFGGGPALDSAQPIALEAGGDVHADLRINMQPAFNIRGSLTGYATDKTVSFELFSGDEDVAAGRTSLDGSTGRFVIHDVIPGAYTLRATQLRQSRGEVPVSVAGADLSGVALALARGVDVPVTIPGSAAPTPAPAAIPNDNDIDHEPQPGCMATLTSTDLRSLQTYRANAPANPVFHDVLPGAYRLSLQCFGGYVSSVTSGTTDLLANPVLTIEGGAAPAPIEVSMKRGGANLTVTATLDSPPPKLWVLLVPLSGASAGTELRQVLPTAPRQAQFENLAPGQYSVYLVSTNEIEFRNPAFLQTLSAGAGVSIQEGGDQQVTLTSLAR